MPPPSLTGAPPSTPRPPAPPPPQNPYDSEVGGVRLLGTSGQPLSDILRYAGAPGVVGAAAGASESEEPAAADVDMGGGAGAAAPVTGSATLDETVATGAGAGAEARAAAGPDGAGVLASLSPLDALHNCLLWRHVAPTAPDTLGCYPYLDSDPFALDDGHLPHLLFAGNQRAYGSRLVGDATGAVRVRVVTVPSFAATGTAVLVNLRSPTLETQPIVFGVGGAGVGGGAGAGAAAAAGAGGAMPEFLV